MEWYSAVLGVGGGGFCSVETADRSSEPPTALVYVTSASDTTGGETKHKHVHI